MSECLRIFDDKSRETAVFDPPDSSCIVIHKHLHFTTFTFYHDFKRAYVDETSSSEIPRDPHLVGRLLTQILDIRQPELRIYIYVEKLITDYIEQIKRVEDIHVGLGFLNKRFACDAEANIYRILGSALSRTEIGEKYYAADALIFTDFLAGERWNEQRPGTVLILNNDALNGPRQGRLIKRILDICTHTSQGLAGRHPARKHFDFMNNHLNNLSNIMKRAKDESQDDDFLFKEVLDEAATISEKVYETRATFTRRVAYWSIVKDKLTELHEQPIKGFTRIGTYFSGRFKPVSENCKMAIECQTGLAKQVEQAVEILETRSDLGRANVDKNIERLGYIY